MTASTIASDYVALSAMVIVMGISAWVVGWRDTTPLLPGNQRRNERLPRLFRWTLSVRRAGVALIVIGFANLVLALFLEGLVS